MAVIALKCPSITVTVVDIDKEKIQLWNSKDLNQLPVFEPGLSEVIKKTRNKNLFFTTNIVFTLPTKCTLSVSVSRKLLSRSLPETLADINVEP